MLSRKIVNREHLLMDRSKPLGPQPAPAKIGYLLVGHGTRKDSGQQQFRALFRQFRSFLGPRPSELAFLELAEPSIPVAISRLAAQGVTALVSVPALLFSAGHAQSDIPAVVGRSAHALGIDVLGQSEALECSPSIIELSAARFQQAVCLDPHLANKAQRCIHTYGGDAFPKVGIAMIGRGSRSQSATEEMLRFTELRCHRIPVGWKTTGFIQVQSPSVTEALDQLQNCDLPIAVVQPHLLFEGELVDQLRAEVGRRQAQNPLRKWIITETLGNDESLAQTLASMATALA